MLNFEFLDMDELRFRYRLEAAGNSEHQQMVFFTNRERWREVNILVQKIEKATVSKKKLTLSLRYLLCDIYLDVQLYAKTRLGSRLLFLGQPYREKIMSPPQWAIVAKQRDIVITETRKIKGVRQL